MTTTVGGIRVRILGDDSDLQKKLGDSAKQLAKYGAAAAAAGAAAAAALTVQGLQAVDAQAKLSRQLGGSIAGLRALEGAAGDAGVSSGVMASALERLNARIGEAQRGTGTAAESFKRLGLDANALAQMDVDQRMATIADRMRDMGLSTQAAGDELRQMGIRNGELINLMIQGGDAIRAEAETVDQLGLALSAVDAAKVEAANDAMGVFSDLMTGITDQLAVQVAPIMTAVGNLIEDAAKEAGGFGEATSDAFGYVVDAAAFVMDAVDGIKRVFELVADGVIAVWGTMTGFVLDKIETIVEVLDKLPGIDMSDQLESIRAFASQTESVVASAVANMNDTLMAPMAGSKFKEFVAQAKDEAQKAAEEIAAQGLEIPQLGGGRGGEEGDEEEAEKHRAKIEERLERIREANMSELELLQEKFKQENAVIDEAFANRILTEEEWLALSRDQKARHEEELTAIEQEAADARTKIAEQEGRAKMQALGTALKNVSTLMNSESRKMFEIGKAAALAGALVDAYAAITGAYKVGASIGGPALGAAYGAAAGLAAFQNVNAIKSAQFGSGGSGAGAAATGSVTGGINQQGQAVTGGVSQSQTLTVQGIDPSQMFSGRQLVDIINTAQKDGAILQVAD